MSKFTEDYVTRNAQLTVKRLYDSFEIEVVANFWDADLRQHVGWGSCCILGANTEAEAVRVALNRALCHLLANMRAVGALQEGEQPHLFDFGEALRRLKAGKRVARAGWNGKGMWLALQRPDAGGKMTLPYIYMKTADDQLVPWLASQTDMLGEDWLEVVTQ